MKKDIPDKLSIQDTKDTEQIILGNTEGEMKKDNPDKQATQGTRGRTNKCQRIPKGNEKGQPRKTGNIGNTRHKTNK